MVNYWDNPILYLRWSFHQLLYLDTWATSKIWTALYLFLFIAKVDVIEEEYSKARFKNRDEGRKQRKREAASILGGRFTAEKEDERPKKQKCHSMDELRKKGHQTVGLLSEFPVRHEHRGLVGICMLFPSPPCSDAYKPRGFCLVLRLFFYQT